MAAAYGLNQLRAQTTSISLLLSYVFDWVVILAIGGIGGAFWHKAPNRRPFSPVDPNISFPYVQHEKVPTWLLAVVALVIPLVITAAVALLFTPRRTAKGPKLASIYGWRLRVWEWNAAWLGLILALALSLLVTEGLKDVIGKPRPDLLARCDLNPETVKQYALGGYGNALPQWNLLVSWTSCRQSDKSKLRDGFQSFPSGHASFSFAGMIYLALYLSAKFGVAIPYLAPGVHSNRHTRTTVRSLNAAPPAWTLVLPLVPFAIATYISATRFSDFRHHGFDILFGAFEGIVFATLSFKLYHMPIRQGTVLSWAARSPSHAWFRQTAAPYYTDHAVEDVEADGAEFGHELNGTEVAPKRPFAGNSD